MVQERFWFVQNYYYGHVDLRRHPDYTGRVEHRFHENDCTLRITDLRERDSAEYKFRFITNQSDGSYTGSPGVTLSVTDPNLKVKLRKSSAHTELQCHSSCDITGPPLYVWYKNGQKIEEETSSLRVSVGGDDSSYSCAVKGHEDYRSAAVYAPKPPSVSVRPSGEIKKGTSVTLTCSSEANPAATYVWYKINGGTPLSKEPQLVFRSIQPSDSGQYYCIPANTMGSRTSEYISINVKYAPTFVSVMVSPSNEIREGSSVTLTCSSDANPAAQYSWYKKNGQKPPSNEWQLSFSSIQSSDSGEYYCTAQNKVGRKRSEYTSIDVKYDPKSLSVSVSPSGEITEGTSLTLTCSSEANPAAAYVWYKRNSQPLSKNPQLIFSSIQSSDSGQYYCIAVNKLGSKRKSITINVKYAPKLPSVSVSPSAEIVEGSSVTLTCSSDANPAANYTWYKEDEDSPKASGHNFTITDITPEHSGSYSCKAQNNRGHHYSTLQLTVSRAWKPTVISGVSAILLALLLISVILWIIKKRSPKQQQPEPGEKSDTSEQLQSADGEVVYTTVRFVKHKAEAVYANIRPAQAKKYKEEDERVVYSAVTFRSASTAPRIQTTTPEDAEDPAALYSTVNRLPRHGKPYL
ncbi:B-cell receptor CD22-like [Pelmatolapia mariae]|uniref:B-cell receptor CD22-like n=1 Tax=Pelmatolapia mariae TaxID=158779 RepID=UPI002FE5072A